MGKIPHGFSDQAGIPQIHLRKMKEASGISSTQSHVLDLIRFLCSQGVLLGHLLYFFGVSSARLGGLASYCVLIFFVLSGFLITYSMIRKTTSDASYNFGSFFRDRFFRIYPPLIGSLVLVFALDIIGFSFTGQIYSLKIYAGNFIINLLHMQEFPLATYINEHYMIEFFRFHYFGTNLPLWTISIEWWLYMFCGFLFFYFIRRRTMKLWHYGLLAMLAISPAYYMLVSARMEKGLTAYWFLGALIAIAAGSGIRLKCPRYLQYLLLAGVFAGILTYPDLGYHGAILVFFICLFLFITTSRDEWKNFNHLLGKFSKRMAGFSYSLYLIHYSLLYFISTVFKPDTSLWTMSAVYLIVNIIAFLFAMIFEQHSKTLQIKYENYRSRRNRLQKEV